MDNSSGSNSSSSTSGCATCHSEIGVTKYLCRSEKKVMSEPAFPTLSSKCLVVGSAEWNLPPSKERAVNSDFRQSATTSTEHLVCRVWVHMEVVYLVQETLFQRCLSQSTTGPMRCSSIPLSRTCFAVAKRMTTSISHSSGCSRSGPR